MSEIRTNTDESRTDRLKRHLCKCRILKPLHCADLNRPRAAGREVRRACSAPARARASECCRHDCKISRGSRYPHVISSDAVDMSHMTVRFPGVQDIHTSRVPLSSTEHLQNSFGSFDGRLFFFCQLTVALFTFPAGTAPLAAVDIGLVEK